MPIMPTFAHELKRASLSAVSQDMAAWYKKNLDAFYKGAELRAVLSDNILKIMPSLHKRLAGAPA